VKGHPANLAERPDQRALVAGDRSLTFGQLHQRASRLAHALADRGLDEGGRLAVMLPNGIPFMEATAASAKLGVAVVTLNWHLRPDEVAWILDDSGAGALVTDERLRPQVEAVAGARSVPVLWYGEGDPPAVAAASDEPIAYRWPTSWPVLYTSGTSGRPKGVVHNAAAAPEIMEMTQDMLSGLWGYTADDVHLAAGPLYHAGPSGYANLTLYVGGTVVLMEHWDAAGFLGLVEAERATTTFLTPAHMIRLLELPAGEWDRRDLSSLRHVIHAGAPCPVDVKRRFIEALPEAEVWELYGASEGGATRVSSAEWLERPGTVGRPWPGVELRILDAVSGDPVPTGEDGVVWVAPPAGRFEYHNDPEKTASAWRDGAFTVGDIGHLDADGYLYLTDRLSDMLIRAGVNVYPREIEEALHRHDGVVDCAVFGVPHDRDGEHPFAVVEVRAGAVTAEELTAWCAERLDPYKVPTHIELVDELPRDPNGKVLKRHLRDRAWAGLGRAI
jgi:long-chain acyl-CoA synthetase